MNGGRSCSYCPDVCSFHEPTARFEPTSLLIAWASSPRERISAVQQESWRKSRTSWSSYPLSRYIPRGVASVGSGRSTAIPPCFAAHLVHEAQTQVETLSATFSLFPPIDFLIVMKVQSIMLVGRTTYMRTSQTPV